MRDYLLIKLNYLKKSNESNEILNIIEGLTYILEMKFIDSYKTFT